MIYVIEQFGKTSIKQVEPIPKFWESLQMSMFTIQCRLCASEETRRDYWQWMQTYTLLVNELLDKIAKHPQFPQWQKAGSITDKSVEDILKPLKESRDYAGLPKRFYASAKFVACDTYKSWLKLHRERQQQLTGKQQWLAAVESELELAKTTNFDPAKIRSQASIILAKPLEQSDRSSGKPKKLMQILLEKHQRSRTNSLTRRAINHLLINNLQVSELEPTLEELSHRLHKKQVEIKRIEEQLASRLPKGRDPTQERYWQRLEEAIALPEVTEDADGLLEAVPQKGAQLPLFNELPYPIVFRSSGDLYWSIRQQKSKSDAASSTSKTRIYVEFKGHKLKGGDKAADFSFQIQCNRRQLPIFGQFALDYQAWERLPKSDRFSEGLFALRSACLIWRLDDTGSDRPKKHHRDPLKPWNTHRLYLHCTASRALLTAEGTERVRREKKQEALKALEGKEKLTEADLDRLGLNKNQVASVKRQRTTVERLSRNPSPFRPDSVPYRGEERIRVGVSFSRHQPVAVAVVDAEKPEVLECYSAKELMNRGPAHSIWRNGRKQAALRDGIERRHSNGGKLYIRQGKRVRWKPYRLVERLHRRHQLRDRLRSRQQAENRYQRSDADSNGGMYIDRAIALAIVELALLKKAGTIVIPTLKGIRESIESDIRARAERLFPHERELQKQYALNYRASFHQWSYARLSKCIQERAQKEGIAVMERQQPTGGDLLQKAISMALSS